METWRTLFDRGAEWGATEAEVRATLAARREDGGDVGDDGIGGDDVPGDDVRAEGAEGKDVADAHAEGDDDV